MRSRAGTHLQRRAADAVRQKTDGPGIAPLPGGLQCSQILQAAFPIQRPQPLGFLLRQATDR